MFSWDSSQLQARARSPPLSFSVRDVSARRNQRFQIKGSKINKFFFGVVLLSYPPGNAELVYLYIKI